MKRTIKTVAFVAVMALSSLALSSCGEKRVSAGNCAVDDAISAAESQVTVIESPVFGKLPSLFEQKLRASTILGKQFRALKTENMDEAIKNRHRRDDAEEALEDFYKKKIQEAANGLDGKTIRVEFDDKQFSAAKATLKAIENESAYFNIVFDATLTKAVNDEIEFKWEYLDATGTCLQIGSDYFVPGKKIHKEYTVAANKEHSMTFDHLYIKF